MIENKYTSGNRLAIEGGSAGGLLMGGVTNMRPDLFKVIINRVPYVDAVVTMLDETIPLVTGDFAEFGNPKIKDQYEVMKKSGNDSSQRLSLNSRRNCISLKCRPKAFGRFA